MVISGHGIAADLPSGWSGRIYREMLAPPEVLGPVTHFGNFDIPMDAIGVATSMMDLVTSGRVACVCIEYIPDDVIQPGVGIYAPQGFPPPFLLSDFDPRVMRAVRSGQAGVQRFFSVGQRPFMLHAVIAEGAGGVSAVEGLNSALKSFQLATTPEQDDLKAVPQQSG